MTDPWDARREQRQDLKDIMGALIPPERENVQEHEMIQKPWGNFTTLYEEKGFKVKKITVNPGGKLSLQFHRHRSEHWVIIKGKGRITVNDEIKYYSENDNLSIPVTARHRAENDGPGLLEIIEVQYGQYLGEDDIVRIEDAYGRAGTV